jgi:hypothetical protein
MRALRIPGLAALLLPLVVGAVTPAFAARPALMPARLAPRAFYRPQRPAPGQMRRGGLQNHWLLIKNREGLRPREWQSFYADWLARSEGGRYVYNPMLEPKYTSAGAGLEMNTALLDSGKPEEVDAARQVLEFAREEALPVVLEDASQNAPAAAEIRHQLAEFGVDLAPADAPAGAAPEAPPTR